MKNKAFVLRDPVILAFLISIVYWIYLALTTRMSIQFDAVGYEHLGRMISEQGWVEYFRTGPNREPMYPALISLAMGLGRILGLAYQLIQASLQLFVLFLSQLLVLYILRILKINNLFTALTVFYLGVSPAIVNSALSLYSEVVMYPLVLVGIILVYKSWLAFTGKRICIVILAMVTSLSFVSMALSKAIFEFVTPVFFCLFLLSILYTRNRKLIFNFLIYLTVFFTIFYLLIGGYKSVNKTFNGSAVIRDSGALVAYVTTHQRMEPLTSEHFVTALAYIPGEAVCQSIFGEEKCRFWSFANGDKLASPKISELNNSKMSTQEINDMLISISKRKILQNPGQFVLFAIIEGAKMFFWESTRIGFVVYPPILEKIFNFTPFKNGLRLGMAFLTLFSIGYLVLLLWRQRRDVFRTESPLLLVYLCLLFIFSFISCYSLAIIITRYALPIAPFYLIIITYVMEKHVFAIRTHDEID